MIDFVSKTEIREIIKFKFKINSNKLEKLFVILFYKLDKIYV